MTTKKVKVLPPLSEDDVLNEIVFALELIQGNINKLEHRIRELGRLRAAENESDSH